MTGAGEWDRQSARALAAARETAVEEQLRDVVAPASPYWQDVVRAARDGGRRGLRALAAVPPSGERDVCPDGDPSGAAALVVQVDERGWVSSAPAPRLRRALLARLRGRDDYRRVVEADTRPTSYVLGGLALPLLLASTRADLDLVARAGARLWRVLGLDAGDVLVSALPLGPTAEGRALELAALASGAPAAAVGEAARDVAGALRLLPATVLAVRPAAAPALLAALDGAGVLGALRTLLLVGAPTADQRRAAAARVRRGTVVLAAHAPSGARVLWGECRESALAGRAGELGFHAYPDLEHLELADPRSGEVAPGETPPPGGGGELLLTQLGFRGSALVRWRTGDLVDGLVDPVPDDPCPACGRRVPRVVGVRAGALVPRLALPGGERGVDLRAVEGALAGVGVLRDWRVDVRRSPRDGLDQLLVHVDPVGDPVDAAVAVARDVRRAAGLLPTQVVAGPLAPREEARRVGRLPSAGGVP